jgi:Na+-translocating ferredoxin:NAD+ oxidoreductase RnfD subunit
VIAALALALVLILSAVSAIHLYWGAGGLWPAENEAALVDTVVGDRRADAMPSRALTFVVATAIEGAALVAALLAVRISAKLDSVVTVVGAALCVVFLARFAFGYLGFWRRRFNRQPFARLDGAVYSPLCLLIAVGFALLVSERL